MANQKKWDFSTTAVSFEKRSIEDIIEDAKTINTQIVAAEVLTWLIINVENYIDSETTMFKLDLVLDDASNMPQTTKLQNLYRAIPDDPNDAEERSEKELDDASKCRRMLDEITAEAYTNIVSAKEVLEKLFERMIFYYERIIPNPENKRRALEIDEELKEILMRYNETRDEEEKKKIQVLLTAKIKEGEALVKFEELVGSVSITKFEYEAFSVGLELSNKKPLEDAEILMGEDEEQEELVKQYTIPEGFTIWLELNYKHKLRPTTLF